MTNKQKRRFWAKVNKTSTCWNWTASLAGGKGAKKYGHLTVDWKSCYAHRVSYAMAYGEIPQGKQILHKCDNPICVRPSHLRAGTIQDNMRDRDSRMRQAYGERSGVAKLKESDVRQIREYDKVEGITQAFIAELFEMPGGRVSSIVNNKCWKYVIQ